MNDRLVTPAAPLSASLARRRWTELGALFVLLPGLIALGPRWLVLAVIMAGGAVCLAFLLADRSFDRRLLFGGAALRVHWRPLLLRTAVVWGALLIVAWLSRGTGGLFLLPRTRPMLWLAVVVLYPLLSAYPQELMFRTFFFHRYGALFPRPGHLIVVNAVLFGWSHIIVHHRIAMALATVGGLLFAWTYQRSRSTALVSLEHALYGDFIFSVGVGGMFVNGVRLLSHVIK